MDNQEEEENELDKEDTQKEEKFRISDKLLKDFTPKYETMNDKPKPKKGKYLKSYNDDY